MSAKKNKKQSDFNSGPFIVALIPAITADLLDMIPIPFLDIILSSPFKLIVAIILWTTMGGISKRIAKILLMIILPLIIDTLVALIPILDWITPMTVFTVLFSWFYAAKLKDKEEKLNLKLFLTS